MKYMVDGWNNFCRVFEVPESFPTGYCFGGGHAVNFQMVDWFQPVAGLSQPIITRDEWRDKYGEIDCKEITEDELVETLVPWMQGKVYVRPNRRYLVLCDFGAVIMFGKGVDHV